MGCGSAILSIAAAKLGAKSVVALDIDKQAIKAADQNVIRNDVSQIVTTSIGTINDISTEKRYQIIFANISSKIIIDILPKIGTYLDASGKAILCGIVFDRKKEIEKHIKDNGFIIAQSDMPFIKTSDINKICNSIEKKKYLVHALKFKNKVGNPIGFDISVLNKFKKIKGDIGAKYIVKRLKNHTNFIKVSSSKVFKDFDLKKDFN